MKVSLAFLNIIFFTFFSSHALADNVELNNKIGVKLGKKIDTVKKSSFPGLYEVTSEGKILYVDESLKYIFSGNIYDIDKRKNITQERLKIVQMIDFKSLPLQNGIQTIRGKPKKTIVVFSDPNCKFCQQLEKNLESLSDVKIVTFLYPILSDDSAIKSRDIWCSQSSTEAWKNWMIAGKKPEKFECDSPNENNLLLGKKLNVIATPVIFFSDGDRITGAASLRKINEKLQTLN